MQKYLPDYISDSIFDIDYNKLYDLGMRGLCFDIDNTLIEMNNDDLHQKAISLINALKNKGFAMCILSNASKKRTAMIGKMLEMKYIHRAFKPSQKGFTKAKLLMNLTQEKCVMIGDQMFTDVLGGNKAGFLTIMTKIIDNNEAINIRIKRIFERLVMRKFERKIKKI
jgi:hypothetical protein